jgi:hypothetical protein
MLLRQTCNQTDTNSVLLTFSEVLKASMVSQSAMTFFSSLAKLMLLHSITSTTVYASHQPLCVALHSTILRNASCAKYANRN